MKLCKKYNKTHAGIMLLLSMASLVMLVIGCANFDYLTQVEPPVFPHADQCGKCHVSIYQEWLGSPHANAYTSIHYHNATNNYQFDKCINCHAPGPVLTNTTPAARNTHRDQGITCVSCHLEQGKLTGPLEPTGMVAPHPIGVDSARYYDSKFCGRCHQGSLVEWNTVDNAKRLTCQQCHMPAVHRKITQATDTLSKILVSMEKAEPQKRHTFIAVPTKLDDPPFTLTVENATSDTGSIVLTLCNNLPHNLPTGDFGVRIAVLEVSGIDNNDQDRMVGRFEFIKELKTALAPGESRQWLLQVPADTKVIHVRLFRHGPDDTNKTVLLNTEVTLP